VCVFCNLKPHEQPEVCLQRVFRRWIKENSEHIEAFALKDPEVDDLLFQKWKATTSFSDQQKAEFEALFIDYHAGFSDSEFPDSE
jgi:hypothetical protein